MFYLSKFTRKNFPIWCNINFEAVFLKSKENGLKINITLHGEGGGDFY